MVDRPKGDQLAAGTQELTMDPEQLGRVRSAMVAAGAQVGPLTATLIAGGKSNLTYRLDDGERSYVLRRPPKAGLTPSAHDVAREFRFVRALSSTPVPVPRAVVLVEETELIGAPFAVTEFVDGTAVRSRADLDALDDEMLEGLVDQLITTLVHLHEVDHEALGIPSRDSSGSYAERQLRRWAGQWIEVGADTTGRAERLIEALGHRVPRQTLQSVVHGDYRCDNTLVTLDGGPKIAAVVDWELATIGDPVADVAMMCAYRHPAFDDVVGFDAAWSSDRLPSRDGLAARYAAASHFELEDWTFHLALASLKIAVIAAGISHRHQAGHESGEDRAARAVGPFLDAGLELL